MFKTRCNICGNLVSIGMREAYELHSCPLSMRPDETNDCTVLQTMPSVSVKDVNQQAFTEAFAEFLKK